MDPMFWLQFLVVMFCVAVGGRLGGVGLGAAGGLGVCIMVLVLGVQRARSRLRSPHHHRGDRVYVRAAGCGRS